MLDYDGRVSLVHKALELIGSRIDQVRLANEVNTDLKKTSTSLFDLALVLKVNVRIGADGLARVVPQSNDYVRDEGVCGVKKCTLV